VAADATAVDGAWPARTRAMSARGERSERVAA
jgi:hypothetical protein